MSCCNIADSLNVTADDFRNYRVIVAGDARYFGSVFIENVNNLPIVPDGASSTDVIQSSSGIDIINIARPDSNGLSNNSYSDFNVLSSGLVFNNSSSAVSSSLAGTIAGNPNYAASDSASLILNQITSNNPSYLGGILEVAGDSAGIIIANPNGIVCDGCSFANTDKVDLITGTANFDTAGVISDYTTTNRDIYIHEANIVVNNFNAIAGNDFFNYVSTIDTDNFNVTAERSFYNSATINADNFNVTAETSFSNRDMQQSMRITSMLQQKAAFPIIMQQSMQITSMLQQKAAFTIMMQQSMRITSMLQQKAAFPISIMQQLVQITSMLQQKAAFPIMMQQSMQIPSMLQQSTFTIAITQQSMQITSMLQQDATLTIIDQQSMWIALMLQQEIVFTIGIMQRLVRITSMLQQETTFTIGIVQQSMRYATINVTALIFPPS